MKFACPCCGYLTLNEEPPGTYEICPVCFWEDDSVQYEQPFFEGGANSVSLTEARRNYLEFGAIKQEFIDQIRKPLPEEIPEERRKA